MFERDLGDGWRVEVSEGHGAILWTPGRTVAGWTDSDGAFETGDYVLRVPATVLLAFLNVATEKSHA
jgi:hypothetical protein